MSEEPEETPAGKPSARAFAAAAIVAGLFGALLIGLVGIMAVAILVRPQEPVRAMVSVRSLQEEGSVMAPGLVLNQVGSVYEPGALSMVPLSQPARAAVVSSSEVCSRLRIEILDEEGSRVQLVLDGEPLGEASHGTESQEALSRLQQRLRDSTRGRELELSVPKGVNSVLLSRVVDTLLASKVSFEVLNQDQDSSR